MRSGCFESWYSRFVLLGIALLVVAPLICAQNQAVPSGHVALPAVNVGQFSRSSERPLNALAETPSAPIEDSHIGPDDLLDITVFQAPELNRTVRVSAIGEISLQLLGSVQAAGLTPRELETVLQERLRRTYMKDPHVGVFVRELQSHSVSVVGAVKMPGVYQIRGTKTVIELLSMAEGLSDDAGDSVLVMRGAGLTTDVVSEMHVDVQVSSQISAQQSVGASSPKEKNEIETINLKNLLESANTALNVPVHPGDIVKVTRAGIVYVVGDVGKPGGFLLKTSENISVLQAVALAQGLTRTSAKSQARIIRTESNTGKRIEIPIDLGKILASKAPDLMLEPKDIVFVPNSTGKAAFYRGAEAAIVAATGAAIYGRY